MQCPEEKEGKGCSRVGEACIVHRPRDQAHQQAQDHSHISGHKSDGQYEQTMVYISPLDDFLATPTCTLRRPGSPIWQG